jgi:hypothetical protein
MIHHHDLTRRKSEIINTGVYIVFLTSRRELGKNLIWQSAAFAYKLGNDKQCFTGTADMANIILLIKDQV